MTDVKEVIIWRVELAKIVALFCRWSISREKITESDRVSVKTKKKSGKRTKRPMAINPPIAVQGTAGGGSV